MDRKELLAYGILLAICATGTYLLLNDKMNRHQIEERVTDRLGFLEEPFY